MAISFLRTIILYFLIIISLRLTGKRQIGDLEPSELVVTIMISELAAVPMQDVGIPILSGVIPIVTLIALELIISVISIKSVGFRALMCGHPAVVIEKGRVLQNEMAKSRLTLDELMESMRMKGFVDVTKVQFAILETNGQLSVIPVPQEAPPTAKDLKVKPTDVELPIIVINDGKLMKNNLSALGLGEDWVRSQLKKHGVKDIKDVFLLSSDCRGNITFEKKDRAK